MICKENFAIFSEEEKDNLIKELNSLYSDEISWEDDGTYPKVIIAKAKNYILWDGKKLKIKGSAFKSSTRSIALKAFMNDVIQAILNDQTNYVEIYQKYVQEIMDSTKIDIKRWATKKTLTERVMESERTNESKVRDALEGSEYVESDKFYVYYKSDNSLSLVEKFDGDYNKIRLLKNLYDCSKVFETILDHKQFINYSLKKNQKLL